MDEIVRTIDEDKVLLVANKIMPHIGNALSEEGIPETLTPMELQLAVHLAGKHISDLDKPMLPTKVYLDEFQKSYLQFVEQCKV